MNGVMHSSALFAVSVVPLLVVAIMQAWGWRSAFYIFGMIGMLWSIVYYLIYRNRPEQHPGVNQAELAHIRGRSEEGAVDASKPASKKAKVPWGIILRSPNTWFLSVGYGTYNYSMYFFVYWLPSYLVEHHHVSIKSMGFLASVPLFSGAIGGVLGGALTDFVYKKTRNLRNARRIVCVMSLLGSALFLIPSAVIANPFTVVWCMSASGSSLPSSWDWLGPSPWISARSIAAQSPA